jgi:diguanylate cyclase (GGDEF)-like protein
MTHIFSSFKLYQKILGIFLVLLLVIGLFLYISLQEIKNNLIENKKIQLVETSNMVAIMAESLFDTAIKNYLRGISETHLNTVEYFYHQYKIGKITENEAKEKSELLLLNDKIGKSGYITAVDISKGKDNITLAIHPKAKGENISHFEFVQKSAMIKNGYIEFQWKNPNEKESRLKAEYMSFFEPWQWMINAAPYKSEFYSLLNLDFFRENLNKIQLLKNKDNYISIIDMEGKVIYHPKIKPGVSIIDFQDTKTKEYFVQNLINNIKKNQKNNEEITGWFNFSYNLNEDSKDKILYYKTNPNLEWIVTTIVKEEEVLEPYYKLKQKLIIIGGVLFVTVIIIALFFVRYITNRLSQLTLVANNFLRHNYNTSIVRNNNDEIGDLEEAFGKATNKIKKLINVQKKINEKLEKKVEKRTHELSLKNKELEQLYVTDNLTGLYNRYKLDEVLQNELERVSRYNRPFGVILVDIDHFKSVNDIYGHKIGDDVLKNLANILKINTRKTDCVGRWGGEEFLIITSETTIDGIERLAQKLRKEIEKYQFSQVGNKTASFGISIYEDKDTINSIILKADNALYKAKENGRNQVCIS